MQYGRALVALMDTLKGYLSAVGQGVSRSYGYHTGLYTATQTNLALYKYAAE